MDLVRAFRARFDDKRTLDHEQELDGALVRAWERGRTAWPAIAVDEVRFAEHLAAALHDAPRLADALDQIEAADLYLALACALGDATAIATLDRE